VANEAQVARLQLEVEAWNTWRAKCSQLLALVIQVELTGAELSGADLAGINISGARLCGSNLSGASLSRALLTRANLRAANLSAADLRGADLGNMDLTRASPQRADLSRAHLYRSRLLAADLSAARLHWAYIGEADFSRAQLAEADLVNAWLLASHFAGVDLRATRGLAAVPHGGPSHVDMLTLLCSRGQIPEPFLRGCGVPGEFIAFARSLDYTPIETPACLISYSYRDQAFAHALQNDLRARNLQCWSAAEDTMIAGNACDRLDESIRVHDAVLVVLSRHSARDDWLEDAVSAALEAEAQRDGQILFPITLDDVLVNSQARWAARVRRLRVADFSGWEDPDAYRKAFAAVLRELKAGGKKGSRHDGAIPK
jgi:hypothetical protein